jgi:hypothetical protein
VLTLQGGAFTCGRARFSDYPPVRTEPTPKVYVKVQFGDRSQPWLAQLDTGAAWSILAPDVARAAGISFESEYPAGLSTRFGIKRGNLVRIPFTLIADEGDPLLTEGTFFISPDWPPGRTFLGYSGLLDSIRFALDPQANQFYFGPGV